MEINKLTNLLLLLFITIAAISCNKDGNETIVLEFGNPQKLIIGSWVITNCQKIYKDGRTETADNNVWRNRVLTFSDNGTYTDSQKQGQTFNWKLTGYKEGEPFTGDIYLEDIICDIISLTTGKWIIQMPGEDNYDWLYEMDKEGSPSGNEGSTVNPPVITNGLISQIIATTEYDDRSVINRYEFFYNENKRIKTFIQNKGLISHYEYDANQIQIRSAANTIDYTAKINLNGYITQIKNHVIDVSYYYDNENYLIQTYNQTVNHKFTYEDKNDKRNLIKFQFGPNTNDYETYSYNLLEANNANIDLNSIILPYPITEPVGGNSILFSPFDFFGKRSNNLLKERYRQGEDMVYTYTYERDLQGRIHHIIRKTINRHNQEEIFNITTFVIYYN